MLPPRSHLQPHTVALSFLQSPPWPQHAIPLTLLHLTTLISCYTSHQSLTHSAHSKLHYKPLRSDSSSQCPHKQCDCVCVCVCVCVWQHGKLLQHLPLQGFLKLSDLEPTDTKRTQNTRHHSHCLTLNHKDTNKHLTTLGTNFHPRHRTNQSERPVTTNCFRPGQRYSVHKVQRSKPKQTFPQISSPMTSKTARVHSVFCSAQP
jgi:hypothetical protein